MLYSCTHTIIVGVKGLSDDDVCLGGDLSIAVAETVGVGHALI